MNATDVKGTSIRLTVADQSEFAREECIPLMMNGTTQEGRLHERDESEGNPNGSRAYDEVIISTETAHLSHISSMPSSFRCDTIELRS